MFNKRRIVVFGVVLLFLMGFVSAGFWGDFWGEITGNVVSDGDLLLHYDFEDSVDDVSGNGKGGVNNGITFVDGISGKAGSFGGGYVGMPLFDFDASDEFSVSVLVKPLEGGNREVIQRSSAGCGNWFIRVGDAGASMAVVDSSCREARIRYNSDLDDGEWHLLTLVYDGAGKLSGYVDGVKFGEVSNAGLGGSLFRSSPVNSAVGIRGDGDYFFIGRIDEVKIWSGALSSLQINDAYDEYFAVTPTPVENVCCEKTNDGGFCQQTLEEECDSDFRFSSALCSDAIYCQLGCCINDTNGIFNKNTLEANCLESSGMRWENVANCSVPGADLGCCVLDDGGAYTTEAACDIFSAQSGASVDFRSGSSKLECDSIIGPWYCIDSDKGENSYVYGEVNIGPISFGVSRDQCAVGSSDDTSAVDSCSGDNCYVWEYYCASSQDSSSSSKTIKCLNGCEDGACIGEDDNIGYCEKSGFDCVSSSECSDGLIRNDYFCSGLDDVCCDVGAKSYVGSWACEIKPAVCPPHGTQTEVCQRYNGELGRRETKEAKLDCSPGACSGCYVPKWFKALDNNKCIPYGFRFEKKVGAVGFVERREHTTLRGENEDYVLNVLSEENAVLTLFGRGGIKINYTLVEKEELEVEIFTGRGLGTFSIYVEDINYIEGGESDVEAVIFAKYLGERIDVLNAYCDADGTVNVQRGDWEKCQNNYECDSNLCSGHECTGINVMIASVSGYKSLGVRIVCRLGSIFGLTNYDECVVGYLGDDYVDAESSSVKGA